MSVPKILIIIPAYNEAGAVGKVVAEVLSKAPDADVCVVDDGSWDATAQEAAAAGAVVVSLPFNLGIGGAVQTGFRYAGRHGYDVAVQVDGDGQHDAAYLSALLKPVVDGIADMTVGSRFMGAGEGLPRQRRGFQSTFGRRLGIVFFTHLIGALTGLRVTDPTSGFRAHNRRMIAAFAQYYPGDFPEPEALVVAKRLGARVREVSVVMRGREAGKSSIGRVKSVYYMMKVTFAILLHMIRTPEPSVQEYPEPSRRRRGVQRGDS